MANTLVVANLPEAIPYKEDQEVLGYDRFFVLHQPDVQAYQYIRYIPKPGDDPEEQEIRQIIDSAGFIETSRYDKGETSYARNF